MKFNYFLCEQHGVVVSMENSQEHLECKVIGMMYDIKKPAKKVARELVSATLVRKLNEKKQIERWEKNQVLEKQKKIRAQERFNKQIPSGDIIVNLLEIVA